MPGACTDITSVSGGASRLTGKEAPAHPDTEQTLEDLRGRVVTQPRWDGKVMSGADYFMEHAIPNFFFHATTAYSILRHNGVNVGKADYLGPLTFKA